MVLSHLFPKVCFLSLYLRDKNLSLHLEAFRTLFQVILKFQHPCGSDGVHKFAHSAPSRKGLSPDWQRGLQQNIIKDSQ